MMHYLVAGLTIPEIANSLNISRRQVRNALQQAYAQLGCENRREALDWWTLNGEPNIRTRQRQFQYVQGRYYYDASFPEHSGRQRGSGQRRDPLGPNAERSGRFSINRRNATDPALGVPEELYALHVRKYTR